MLCCWVSGFGEEGCEGLLVGSGHRFHDSATVFLTVRGTVSDADLTVRADSFTVAFPTTVIPDGLVTKFRLTGGSPHFSVLQTLQMDLQH